MRIIIYTIRGTKWTQRTKRCQAVFIDEDLREFGVKAEPYNAIVKQKDTEDTCHTLNTVFNKKKNTTI